MSKRNIVMTAFVAVGLVASLGYASIAQSPAPTTSPSPEVTPTTSPSPEVSPTPAPTTSPSPEASPTPSPSPANGNRSSLSQVDREFMVKAAQGGMAEVQYGQIALQRASSNTVRQYAQRMIQEHTKANNELKALAKAKGVTLPKNIGEKNQKLKQRLLRLSGARFDREYMEEAGVKSHEEQAKLFERQIERGQNPDVIDFARKTLPVVQMHLQQAEQITGDRSESEDRVR